MDISKKIINLFFNNQKGKSVTASRNGLSEKTIFNMARELNSWKAITGKTIETAAGEAQIDTIQETADATIQKTSAQFPTIYIILIAAGIYLL